MKEYIVKVNDATEEVAFNKAQNVLKFFKTAFAAIYGYSKNNKNIWLIEPIICKDQAELMSWQKKFNDNQAQNKVILHTLFQRNVRGDK